MNKEEYKLSATEIYLLERESGLLAFFTLIITVVMIGGFLIWL